MSFYLDTSAVVSLLFDNAHSFAAQNWAAGAPEGFVFGAWLETEFFALVRRWQREGKLDAVQAELKIEGLLALIESEGASEPIPLAAGPLAAELARDPALKLSAVDALHLACAVEGGHCLVTFDTRLADAANARGFEWVIPKA